ncbi:MAG: SDR family oxidoreductase [Chloroflexi bacterium]|nr:SDR family oxidoreductase [Chloroflexota bacterium]
MSIVSKFLLTDRVAVIQGAGSGMGKSVARALAEAGADIVAAGINVYDKSKTLDDLEAVAAHARSAGRKALTVAADVRDGQQVADMVEKAMAGFGRIDILVNAAGGSFAAPALEISDNGWDAVLRENLKSVFVCCKAVGKVMIAQGKGSIINFASMAGRASSAGNAHYGAAKAGIISLTQSLAEEWGPYHIRVNALAPGTMKTEGWVRVQTQWVGRPEADIVKNIPLGRMGTSDDAAGLAVFLASDASDYITGQTINLNGGERGYYT